MIIFTIIILLTAAISVLCAFTNSKDIVSANILLASLGIMVLVFGLLSTLDESNTSIINTYCTKYYSNNVALYNECKYNHKGNFSKVIKKGLK